MSAPVPSPHPDSHRAVGAFLYAGFVLTGIITTLLGPAMPFLAERWSLSDAVAGTFFTAQFLGAILGNVILSLLIQRAGFRSTFVVGYALMCAGVATLAAAIPWPLPLLAVFCYGCGIGLTIPSTNLWVAEANPSRRASVLNVLNLAWSIGALLCPAAAAFCSREWGFPVFLMIVAALAGSTSLALAFNGRLSMTAIAAKPDVPPRKPAPMSLIACMAGLFFLYVGVENSVSGWVSTLVRRAPAAGHWVMAPAFFWGMLLVGRAAAAAVLKSIEEVRLASLGLAIAAVGCSLLVTAEATTWIYAGASLAGLGLSSVYPIAIAAASRAFSSRTASLLFLLSGLGGASMPWLVGAMSTRAGSLRLGLTIPVAAIGVMLAFEYRIAREN